MSNSSDPSDDWQDSMQAIRVSLVAIFGLVILIGICGNALVLLLVICVKSMQTIVNISFAMLSLADLLVLTLLPVLPISNEFANHHAHIGRYMCAFLNTYDRGAIFFSVLIYIFVTVNRYIAVCDPLRTRRQNDKLTFVIGISMIILVTTATSVPYSYIYSYRNAIVQNKTICHCFMAFDDPWEVIYETVMSIARCFLPVPFLFMLNWSMIKKIQNDIPGENYHSQHASRRRRNRQIAKVLMVVVCIFVVCNFPMTILLLLNIYVPETMAKIPPLSHYILLWISRIFLYINSASNPVVYFTISTKYQRALVILFCCGRQPAVQPFYTRGRLPTDSRSEGSSTATCSRRPTVECLPMTVDHM